MSIKSNKQLRKMRWKPDYWHLQDDKSGFVIGSDECKIDHRGRITSAKLWDPIHPTEMPVDNYFTPERVMKVTRVPSEEPAIVFIHPTDAGENV